MVGVGGVPREGWLGLISCDSETLLGVPYACRYLLLVTGESTCGNVFQLARPPLNHSISSQSSCT